MNHYYSHRFRHHPILLCFCMCCDLHRKKLLAPQYQMFLWFYASFVLCGFSRLRFWLAHLSDGTYLVLVIIKYIETRFVYKCWAKRLKANSLVLEIIHANKFACELAAKPSKFCQNKLQLRRQQMNEYVELIALFALYKRNSQEVDMNLWQALTYQPSVVVFLFYFI